MKSRSGTDAEGPLSSPKGQVSESDAQGLRALAEEISREFAPRLEQTALVLYDRDPEHLQAQWHVTTQALAEARDLFPGDGADLRQVLRLCRLDQDGRAEVIASTPQGAGASREAGQNDFALHGDGTEYVCELSLESDAGGWLLLARSNRIRPGPRIAPAPDAGQARHAGDGMARGPDGFEVEAALAAVGGPLHPVFPNLEPDAPPPGHPAPLGEALDQTRPRDLGLFMPDVSGDSTSPAALAVVGRPLHPVFPNLAPDASPPGHSAFLAEALGRARPGDRGLEFPPGVLWEPATDASLDAEIMAMPPPLIPSSPGLGTSTADMPGPLYDPRGALSSAVLGGVRPSPSN